MDGRWSASYPEHDRTSCSDSNLFNRDPAGRWCRRCTAIMMDRGEAINWTLYNELLDMDYSKEDFSRAKIIIRTLQTKRDDYFKQDYEDDYD